MLPQLVSLNQSEKLAHEENLTLSLTVTYICPSLNVLTRLRQLKTKKQTKKLHVIGFILIYCRLNAKTLIMNNEIKRLIKSDNPSNINISMKDLKSKDLQT